MISVALIEDNRIVRESLAVLLREVRDLSVVVATSDDESWPPRVNNLQVIVLDVELSNDDSLRVARRVRTQLPESKVVMMDLPAEQDHIVDYVNAGVSGFILKDASPREFASTIRTVAAGEYVLPPQMTTELFAEIAARSCERRHTPAIDSAHLTPREREVVELLGEGLSNKEIAARLGIASHTVKSHVRNVMEKLALHTRLQVAAAAHRHQ